MGGLNLTGDVPDFISVGEELHVVGSGGPVRGVLVHAATRSSLYPALVARLDAIRAAIAETLQALGTAGAADVAALAERLTAFRDAEADAVTAVGATLLRRRVETDETHREVYEALEDDAARCDYLASLIDRVAVKRGSRHVPLRERVQVEYAPRFPSHAAVKTA